jgi:hypothetical protein
MGRPNTVTLPRKTAPKPITAIANAPNEAGPGVAKECSCDIFPLLLKLN